MSSLLDGVRAYAKDVASAARFVTIDHAAIEPYAHSLPLDQPRMSGGSPS